MIYAPVKKVPLKDLLPKFKTTNGLTHAVVMETPNGPLIVNVCSANYTIVTNEQIFKPIRENLEENFKIEESVRVHKDARFYIDYLIKNKAYEVLKNDALLPKITIQNSYDSGVKFGFKFGFHRVVCSNGLTVPEQGGSKMFGMMHTPSIVDRVDSIMEETTNFISNIKDSLDHYRNMAEHKLSREEAIQKIQDIVDRTKAPTKKMEDMIVTMDNEHKSLKQDYSNWLVYNAINQQLFAQDSKMAPHKQSKEDAKILSLLS